MIEEEEEDDIDAIYEAAFESGYDQGYNVGYSEALEDKDRTDDNLLYNKAIDDVIDVINNYQFDERDELIVTLHLLRKL